MGAANDVSMGSTQVDEFFHLEERMREVAPGIISGAGAMNEGDGTLQFGGTRRTREGNLIHSLDALLIG